MGEECLNVPPPRSGGYRTSTQKFVVGSSHHGHRTPNWREEAHYNLAFSLMQQTVFPRRNLSIFLDDKQEVAVTA